MNVPHNHGTACRNAGVPSLVVPNDKQRSLLYLKMAGLQPAACGDVMPRGTSADVDAVIAAKGLQQMSDSGELERILDAVLSANPKSVEEFRAGKDKAFNALVGQVMKASKGKANPTQASDLLRRKLGAAVEPPPTRRGFLRSGGMLSLSSLMGTATLKFCGFSPVDVTLRPGRHNVAVGEDGPTVRRIVQVESGRVQRARFRLN